MNQLSKLELLQSKSQGRWLNRTVLDLDPWYLGLAITDEGRQTVYRQWMNTSIHPREWGQIRENTQQGRMIGSEKFQREVENSLGRKIIGVMPGRPKKALPVDQK